MGIQDSIKDINFVYNTSKTDTNMSKTIAERNNKGYFAKSRIVNGF